jgi:hypothetical protein
MKIHIELELTQKTRRILLGLCIPAVLLGGGAVAYAQATSPGALTTSDVLIGTALSSLGTAVATLQVQVASLQAADHVARATLNADGNVMSQTAGWIKQVSHPSTGKYVLRFAPNAFTTMPTCVTTPTSDGAPPFVECYGVSATSITCQTDSVHGPVDVGLSLICAGT